MYFYLPRKSITQNYNERKSIFESAFSKKIFLPQISLDLFTTRILLIEDAFVPLQVVAITKWHISIQAEFPIMSTSRFHFALLSGIFREKYYQRYLPMIFRSKYSLFWQNLSSFSFGCNWRHFNEEVKRRFCIASFVSADQMGGPYWQVIDEGVRRK